MAISDEFGDNNTGGGENQLSIDGGRVLYNNIPMFTRSAADRVVGSILGSVTINLGVDGTLSNIYVTPATTTSRTVIISLAATIQELSETNIIACTSNGTVLKTCKGVIAEGNKIYFYSNPNTFSTYGDVLNDIGGFVPNTTTISITATPSHIVRVEWG